MFSAVKISSILSHALSMKYKEPGSSYASYTRGNTMIDKVLLYLGASDSIQYINSEVEILKAN